MRVSFVAACVVSVASWGSVQTAASHRLPLDEAIRLGLSRNPELTSSRALAEVSGARLAGAEAERWPRVVTEAVARRSNNQVIVFGDKLTAAEFEASDFALDNLNHPDAISHFTAGLGLEAALFTSGRVRWGIESARAAEEAARAALRSSESDLAARISRAYFAIALARESGEVAQAALAGARGHEAAAAARFEAGSALKSDRLRTQVFTLTREKDVELRLADLAIAQARLAALLGLDPSEELEPITPLEPPSSPIGSLEEWLARGSASAPSLEASRLIVGAATAGARAVRSERGPDVSGFARYERNAGGFEAGEGSYLVGLGIRWTPFDAARAARISEAEARRAAAEASGRAVVEAVRLEIVEAWYAAVAAERSLAVSREAVEAAEAARRIAVERYAGGLLSLTDLLDMETDLINARFSRIEALYRTVTERVRLAHAAGALEVPSP